MLRYWKRFLFIAGIVLAAPSAIGFSLLGPGGAEGNAAKLWQLPPANAGWDIGYNQAGLDIGGPMTPPEAYRWNVPLLTYAFDSSFINFFGSNGVKEVSDVFRILNDLPPASRMSEDLTEFPLNTAHLHPEAAQLGLMDLKSVAMGLVLEHLGLADAVRWNFSIYHREPLPPSPYGLYTVRGFNYDPVTLQQTPYINGTLYTYHIFEVIPATFSEAVEDLLAPPGIAPNIPVASMFSTFQILNGIYYTGLTRDDVGGLRFLLLPRHVVVETLLPGTFPRAVGGWTPILGTNFLGTNFNAITNIIGGTNNIATAGLRGGVNKIRFRRVNFDSILGQGFTTILSEYDDFAASTNSTWVRQRVLRPIVQPDFIFAASDLGNAIAIRTDTTSWINNDLLNGSLLTQPSGGPGLITPPVVIEFNSGLPYTANVTPFFIQEPFRTDPVARASGYLGPIWASFDGSTNAPVIYPAYFNYNIIRNMARGAQ